MYIEYLTNCITKTTKKEELMKTLENNKLNRQDVYFHGTFADDIFN